MPSSSSVQQARQALADRLRQLRLDAGLTGKALAEQAGWHRTKVPKLEHAIYAPSDEDLRAWCEICGVHDQIPDLIATARAVDLTWTEWRRLERAGLKNAQESVIPLWENTRRFRIYSPFLIPGPIQTPSYVRALLEAIRARRPIAIDDIDEAVEVRIRKQQVIHQAKTFAILLEENTLYHRIGGAAPLAEALTHLLEVMTLPSISLGIIPFTADRAALRPVEMFFLFDDVQVNVELVSGWLRVTRPAEIVMYADAFALLNAQAVYGRQAQDLIKAALDELQHP